MKKYVPAVGENPAEVTIFVYDAAGKLVAEYSTIVASTNDAKVAYLTNDHLGSPRINTDKNGKVTARHDYNPFGEEIATSQRTSGLGYTDDTVRKQFTGYERDIESELDFAQARYFAYGLGRYSSVDPYNIILEKNSCKDNEEGLKKLRRYQVEPQNWNRYVYVLNSPLKYTDPTGRIYLRSGEMIYYIEDEVYASLSKSELRELRKLIGSYTIVEEGSIITVGNIATGIFEPYRGKRVVLGAKGKLYDIDEFGTLSLGDLGTVQSEHAPETPPLDRPDDDMTWGYFRSIILEADDAEKRHFDRTGRSNPYWGGYRHCVASCTLTQRFGSLGVGVRSVWDLIAEHNNPAPDSRSDMVAENIGQFLGTNPSNSCELMCLNAYPPR
ncbi:MAG: hypothetical protein IPM25_19950 [Chloracidobacterium sp.]|nr:hypothetical protein [Chloracidobacterium sp.]